MEAMEAIDCATLRYFIKQPDVKFLRVRKKGIEEAYVQSKLTAIESQDEGSNGTGVVESQVILYNVNKEPKAKKESKSK